MPRPSYCNVGPSDPKDPYIRRKLEALTEHLMAEEWPGASEWPSEWDEKWSTVRTARVAEKPLQYLQRQRWMEEERGDYSGPARWTLDHIHGTAL